MFFSSWHNILKVLVVGVLAYFGLIILLRISGKRTLASMNMFDLVVTVAFGSTLSATILPDRASLSDGLLALGLLIGLQWVVAKSVVRSPDFAKLIKSEPTLILHQGKMIESAMERERVGREEILASIRKHGLNDISRVEAVIMETDGTMSVIAQTDHQVTHSTLDDVPGTPAPGKKNL